MPPQLLALTDGPSILLDKPILLLGRHEECDIQLVSRKVSRRHCCIAQVADYLVVRDLGSTNGIRINGIKVNEGSLNPGDELTIGNYRYELRWESLAGEAPAPRRPTAVGFEEPLQRVAGSHKMADDALESCDEPVPLPEPDSLGISNLLGGSLFPKPDPGPPAKIQNRADDPARSGREPASLILPDQIDLAPISSIVPPIDKKNDDRPKNE